MVARSLTMADHKDKGTEPMHTNPDKMSRRNYRGTSLADADGRWTKPASRRVDRRTVRAELRSIGG